MKNSNAVTLGANTTHFLSDVYSEGKLVAQGVKSKLILNNIKYIEPLLILYPPEDQVYNLVGLFEVEIKGYLENVGGDKIGEIHILRGYVINRECTSHGSSWKESFATITPSEIYQKHYRKEANEKTSVTYSLTNNNMVKPLSIIKGSLSGEVKPEIKPGITLKFGDDWIAKFEKNFSYVNTQIEQVEGTFSASQLALTLEKDNFHLSSVSEIHTVSDLVDDLLWYLSFSSRQKTTWTKWTSVIGTELVKYYRVVPIPERISEYEEPLITRDSFQRFLQHCLEYEKQQNRLDIRLPIIYLVSANKYDKTIESQFLSLFMSLEALLNVYAESRNKNVHLIGDAWTNFYNYMEKSIKECTCIIDDDKVIMARKLGIFNQPSVKALYDDFCADMKVDNSDFWPIGHLSTIRGKLIHGKRFKYELFFVIATQHLRWIVERCLLATLGWKMNTDVTRGALKKYTAYLNWKSYCDKN